MGFSFSSAADAAGTNSTANSSASRQTPGTTERTDMVDLLNTKPGPAQGHEIILRSLPPRSTRLSGIGGSLWIDSGRAGTDHGKGLRSSDQGELSCPNQ